MRTLELRDVLLPVQESVLSEQRAVSVICLREKPHLTSFTKGDISV